MAHLPISVADLPMLLLVLAILFVAAAVALVDPLLIPILAVPGVLAIQRVGGASLNLSVSDVLTVAGTLIALPLVRGDMRATRRLLSIVLLFEAVLLLTVVAHTNSKSVFEWGHRFFLVGGSIAIGAALSRARRANGAVVAFLVLTSAVSVAAVANSVAHGFAPAQPFGLQKNFVGAMAASAMLLALLRPAWLRLTDVQLHTVVVLCAAGLLVCQSRGAMLALGAALLIAAMREGRLSRRSLIGVIFVVPLVVFAVSSVWHESDQTQINSLTYRANFSALAYREWHLSPLFGQGLRFFKQPGALLQADAHNVIATTLAEGGLVGLVALALLIGLALYALWRLPPPASALAVAFVAGRFVHGLFDVYWVAGTTTLPWLIVGIVCGSVDADEADRVAEAKAKREPVLDLRRY